MVTIVAHNKTGLCCLLFEQAKELASLLFLFLLASDLLLHLLVGDGAAEGVPDDSEHTNDGGEHTTSHRANTPRVPAKNLRVRTFRQTREIQDVGMARCIARCRQTESLALIESNLRDAIALLGLEGRLDEGDC